MLLFWGSLSTIWEQLSTLIKCLKYRNKHTAYINIIIFPSIVLVCGLIRWKDYRKSLCHNDSLKWNHRSKFIAAKYTTFKTSSSVAINHGCWGIWWQRLNCCKGYCCASNSCNCHQIVCQLLTGQKCCPASTMGGSVTAVGEAVCATLTTSNSLPDRHLWVIIFYSVAEVLSLPVEQTRKGNCRTSASQHCISLLRSFSSLSSHTEYLLLAYCMLRVPTCGAEVL